MTYLTEAQKEHLINSPIADRVKKEEVIKTNKVNREFEKDQIIVAKETQAKEFDPAYLLSADYKAELKAKVKRESAKLLVALQNPPPFISECFKGIVNLTPNELIGIGAVSGNGKSLVICNIIVSNIKAGKRCLLISNEMQSMELLYWIACIDLGIDNTSFENPCVAGSVKKAILKRVDEIIDNDLLHIVDDFSITTSSEQILKTLRAPCYRGIIDMVLVDYLSNIRSATNDGKEGNYWDIEMLCSNLRDLSNNAYPIVIACQMKPEGGAPVQSRLSMGHSIYRYCSTFIEVVADRQNFKSKFNIAKSRHSKTTTIELGWLNGHFVSLTDADYINFKTNMAIQQIQTMVPPIAQSAQDDDTDEDK